MSSQTPDGDLLRLTTSIVSAHVSKNAVSITGLSDLIHSVYAALNAVKTPAALASEVRQQPSVPIKKSVSPDYIVCLEDGKKLKMLKRHLESAYNMTPDEYRARWRLPADYPMVAPNYAAHRSTLAKQIGLGRKPEPIIAPVVEVVPPEVPEVAVQRIPERKRGRKPGSKNRVSDQLNVVPE